MPVTLFPKKRLKFLAPHFFRIILVVMGDLDLECLTLISTVSMILPKMGTMELRGAKQIK
jgi:hypothetical protein